MNKHGETMARDVAKAAITFEHQRTGRSPESVSVTLGEATLVITLQGALSPAELALARTPGGAAKVEELQQQLFETAGDVLRQEIHRITGASIEDATTKIDCGRGSVISSFPSGTLVQVYLLAGTVPAQHWAGSDPGDSVFQDTTR